MRTALAILSSTLSAALALANPLAARHGAPICPSGTAYSSMQCCAVNVADVVSLDCQPPGPLPSSAAEFKEICAKIGDKPQCCTLALVSVFFLCYSYIVEWMVALLMVCVWDRRARRLRARILRAWMKIVGAARVRVTVEVEGEVVMLKRCS